MAREDFENDGQEEEGQDSHVVDHSIETAKNTNEVSVCNDPRQAVTVPKANILLKTVNIINAPVFRSNMAKSTIRGKVGRAALEPANTNQESFGEQPKARSILKSDKARGGVNLQLD